MPRSDAIRSSSSTESVELVQPALEYLPGYVSALERGWSPDNLRPDAWSEQLAAINHDSELFLAQQTDRDAKGPPINLPDGSSVPRLPGYSLWMWDGDFCGSIGFRWQPGTTELPPHCFGHIGYAVVPWKRNRGYATQALRLMVERASEEGLSYVELTTACDNLASQRVIETNGGTIIERFTKRPEYGGAESFRYRIPLGVATAASTSTKYSRSESRTP
jgi:predicted acetyltransferase